MKKEVNYYIDQSVADRELDKVIAELNSIRANVAESVDVRAEKEREFVAKQTTRLTAMFDLEEKLLKYRLDNSGSNQDIVKLKRQEALKKNNSTMLAKFMYSIGKVRPPSGEWEAHHIICSKHASHLRSKLRLFKNGMGINDPSNGCWLPVDHKSAKGSLYPSAVGHKYLHTKKYAEHVLETVGPARNKSAMSQSLKKLEKQLLSARDNEIIANLLTKKGKKDLLS
ncbi:AHH domain-containing protein [Sessilibacter sp. MAH4]